MDHQRAVTAEERFRAAVLEAAARLGIDHYFLGFKDPDSMDVKRVFRGDGFYIVGMLRCAETEIRVNLCQGSRPVPPPRPAKPGLAPGEVPPPEGQTWDPGEPGMPGPIPPAP